MTSTSGGSDPQKPSGYRGALPERNDTLARPWILAVIGILVLIFVLSALEVPSRFLPEPTPVPSPSIGPVESSSAEPSADGSAGASDEASPEASGEASASAGEGSAEPSGTP